MRKEFRKDPLGWYNNFWVSLVSMCLLFICVVVDV
jgi:hypothetical protein